MKKKVAEYVIKSRRDMRLSKNDLGIVIQGVKQRMLSEHKDSLKRIMWAEVGLELNKMYLNLKTT